MQILISVMWVDDYAPELGVFAARCEYMKPGWADMRYRIVDVGFLGMNISGDTNASIYVRGIYNGEH